MSDTNELTPNKFIDRNEVVMRVVDNESDMCVDDDSCRVAFPCKPETTTISVCTAKKCRDVGDNALKYLTEHGNVGCPTCTF